MNTSVGVTIHTHTNNVTLAVTLPMNMTPCTTTMYNNNTFIVAGRLSLQGYSNDEAKFIY